MATNPIAQQVTALTTSAASANRITTLKCAGKLVLSSAAQFSREAKRWIDCSSELVVDIGGLTYIDSAGLGALVGAYTSAKNAGCEFRLLNVTPRIMHLLQLTNLNKILKPTMDNLL